MRIGAVLGMLAVTFALCGCAVDEPTTDEQESVAEDLFDEETPDLEPADESECTWEACCSATVCCNATTCKWCETHPFWCEVVRNEMK